MAGDDELVRAAAEARTKTTQAHESLTHAHDSCEQRKAAVAALQPRIATDREALVEALEELGRVTGEAATRLGNAVTQASGALVELDEIADGLADAAPRMLASEAGALDDAAAGLQKIDAALAQSLESVETMHRSAFERVDSAVHRLEEGTQRVEATLRDDGAAPFTRGKEKLEPLLHDSLALLETTIPEALARRAAEWQQRREAILARAEETFAAMIHHVEEVTATTAAKLGSALGAERDARQANATTLATELTALARSLDSRRGELEATIDALAERFTTEHDALHTLDGHLEAVRGRWATFGFSA